MEEGHSPFHHGIVSQGDAFDLAAPAAATDRASVVVLGGGIAANALALALARGHARPLVLVSRSNLADPSTEGLGIILPTLGDDPARLARAMGTEISLELYQFACRAVARVKAIASELGVLCQAQPAVMAARGEAEREDLEQSKVLMEDIGATVGWLEGPALVRHAGPGFRGGLLWEEGALLNPLELNLALARAAIACGARYVFDAPAETIEEDSGGLTIHTPKGRVKSEFCVLAAGVALRGLLPFLDDCVLCARVQFAASGPDGCTPVSPGSATFGFDYWRPSPVGGMMIGGGRYLSPEHGLIPLNHSLEARVVHHHDTLLAQLSSGRHRTVVARWTRLIDLGCDNLPLVGSLPGRARVFALLGFSGLDSTLGLLAAEGLAAELLESAGPPLPAHFSPRRML